VDEAVREFVDAGTRRSAETDARVARELERVRSRIATLLVAHVSEIAFVPNALRGLEQIAEDVDWRRGDVVVIAGDADALPWSRLASRGVELHRVPTEKAALRIDRLESALRHPRARLLALDSVDPASGARAPLEVAGALCRERGVLFAVEASQHLGCLDLGVAACGIDYLVSDAHRFLLGLAGTGVLFRSRRSSPDAASARQAFESGPPNAVGITALGAAVDLLLELGLPGVERRVLSLCERLLEGLEARGIAAAVPRELPRSGIVGFRIDGEPAARTAERLLARRIRVATTAAGVRVSPHCYIEASEIDALLEVL
jgi:selenocysteine lyase/cysteine desulfurase